MLLKKCFLGLAAAAALASCGPANEPAAKTESKPATAPVAPEKPVATLEVKKTDAPTVPLKDAAPKPTPAPVPSPAPAVTAAPHAVEKKEDHNWYAWRGPLQTGESVEHHSSGLLEEKPAWTYDSNGRGTPVVVDGKVFSFGYRGNGDELVELLTCLDEKTGKKEWEIVLKDFLSDTVYDRYSIGSPVVDPETKNVYLITAYGVFLCVDFHGKELWRHSLMEEIGRMTFPNSKVGSPVIEGDLVIFHGITSNWGADGPPADRFYAYDKITGEIVWSSMPGESPPKDNAHSTPIITTLDGKRVILSGAGCGNIVALNARTGKPLWRHKMSKGGVNGTVLIHKNNKVIAIHGEENPDNADKGRMVCAKLPEHFEKEQMIFDPAVDAEKWKANELWRAPLRAETSSPILVGDHVYDVTDTGHLFSLNAETGEIEWDLPLTSHNIHSSPLFSDGLIYFAAEEGAVFVVKPGVKSAEVVQKIPLEGSIFLGAPVISNSQLYVHAMPKAGGTTAKLYCFKLKSQDAKWDAVPVADIPKAGAPAALQIIPSEFAMHPAEKISFRIRSVDANGLPVGPVAKASWESFIPPTAKVKATVDAKFNEAGELVAEPTAKLSAGAFKATGEGGISGTVRGRILPNLPIKQDFESFELTQDQPTENIKFAYPPLPWIGARFKFDIRDLNGNKVLAKTLDNIMFQRATIFLSTPDKKNYTMQADVMTDGNARSKSDIGLINQRYMIVLRGNANVLEVSSNSERLRVTAPFKMTPNVWYVLKTKVDVKPDGSGVVHAKVWDKTQPEPEAWTLDVPVSIAHTQGAPGIFGFTQLNQKRIYLDNLLVTPNE